MSSKYKNMPVVINGIRFASKAEGRRYQELRLLFKAGKIRGLAVHPRFPLDVNEERICVCVPDFTYFEAGEPVIEDVKGGIAKGTRTEAYRIKKKLLFALYGLEIREIVYV